jgi:hypothetical protein
MAMKDGAIHGKFVNSFRYGKCSGCGGEITITDAPDICEQFAGSDHPFRLEINDG